MSAPLLLSPSKLWRSRNWGLFLEVNSVANLREDVERYKLKHVVITPAMKIISSIR